MSLFSIVLHFCIGYTWANYIRILPKADCRPGALVDRGACGAEGRGAADAEGGGVWGVGVPLPNGGGVWLKIVHFGVYSDKNSQFMRPIAGLKTACK